MPAWVPTGAAVAAVLAHLMAGGFLYLPTPLVAPTAAAVLLDVWWLALLVTAVLLWRRRSLWVLAVPGVAVATWVAVILAGRAWLGWTA